VTAPRSVTAIILQRDWAIVEPAVRAVHERRPMALSGHATVRRGLHPLARLAAWAAGLPRSQAGAPLRVVMEQDGDAAERWTRWFGASAPMRSTLRQRGDLVDERLGITSLRYRFQVEGGAIRWQVIAARTLFVSWPKRWLKGVQAMESVQGGRYYFDVGLVLPWLGLVFHYTGTLTPEPPV
jgi:hypothetical protein